MEYSSRPSGPGATLRILSRRMLPVLFILIYITFFFPFWKSIIAGIIFACGCSPMVTWMKQRLSLRRNISSYVFIAGATLFLMVSLTLFFTSVYSFISEIAKNGKQFLVVDVSDLLTKIETRMVGYLGLKPNAVVAEIFGALRKAGRNIDQYITGFAQEIVQNVPDFLLQLFIFFLIFFSVVVYRGRIYAFISNLFSVEGQDLTYMSKFEQMCSRTLGSIFIIGIIQALIVVVGISIVHASESLLFLFNLTFVFSLIPILGAAVVPFVVSLSSFFNGDVVPGVVLLITAGIAGSIDNILKGYFFSKAANSNAVVSLIALLGSLALFGFIGLFLAPVIEQIVMAIILNDSHENKGKEIAV